MLWTTPPQSHQTHSDWEFKLDHIDNYPTEVNGNVEMVTEFFTEHLGQLITYGAILDNPMEIFV